MSLRTYFAPMKGMSLAYACVFIWAVMFVFSYLSPFMTDNYLFSRNMVPGYAEFMSGAPIEALEPMSLTAAFKQSVHMYNTWCGRFMGNFLVYTSFLLPKLLRLALSAALFLVTCLLIHANIFGRSFRKKLDAGSLLTIAAFVWVGMPSFGSAFFWVSVGGMPAIVAQLLFLLPYRYALEEDETGSGRSEGLVFCLFFFLFAVACASLDYATSAAMPCAAGTGLLLQFFFKRRISPLLLAGFLGISLGAALTLLAPGNAGRMALTTDADVHIWLASSFSTRLWEYLWHLFSALIMQGLPLLLLIWGLLAQRRTAGKNWTACIPYPALLYLVPFAATHAAYFFTPWPPARAFATTTIQLLVAAAIVSQAARTSLPEKGHALRLYSLLLCLVFAFSLMLLVDESAKLYQVHSLQLERDQYLAQHKGEDVRVPPFPVHGDRHMVLGSHLNDIGYEPAFWFNRALAAYWGLKSVALRKEHDRRYTVSLTDRGGEEVKVEMSISGHNLQVECRVRGGKRPAFDELHAYYYGSPGLIRFFPQMIGDKLAKHLNGAYDVRAKLVPILFARSDISLNWQQVAASEFLGRGSSTLWGMYEGRFPFWLVRPGEEKFSFRLLPVPDVP